MRVRVDDQLGSFWEGDIAVMPRGTRETVRLLNPVWVGGMDAGPTPEGKAVTLLPIRIFELDDE